MKSPGGRAPQSLSRDPAPHPSTLPLLAEDFYYKLESRGIVSAVLAKVKWTEPIALVGRCAMPLSMRKEGGRKHVGMQA